MEAGVGLFDARSICKSVVKGVRAIAKRAESPSKYKILKKGIG